MQKIQWKAPIELLMLLFCYSTRTSKKKSERIGSAEPDQAPLYTRWSTAEVQPTFLFL